MDRAALQQLLQESEGLLQREDTKIAHQRDVIAALERRDHDATAARLLLRRLEVQQARHIADRNRLFKEWTDTQARQSVLLPSEAGEVAAGAPVKAQKRTEGS